MSILKTVEVSYISDNAKNNDTKSISLYDLDTDESFENRVAKEFGVIREWISPPDKLIDKIKINNNVSTLSIDLLSKDVSSYIKDIKEKKRSFDIGAFITEKRIKEKKYAYPLDKTVFYLLSKYTPDIPLQFFIQIVTGSIDQLGIPFTNDETMNTLSQDATKHIIENFIKNEDRLKKKFTDEIDSKIRNVMTNSNKFTDNIKQFIGVPSAVHYPAQVKEFKVRLTTGITRDQISLDTVFSHLVCTPQIPLFSYNNIYKTYEDLRELSESQMNLWKFSRPNKIYGYIYLPSDDKIEIGKSEYTNIIIKFSDDDEVDEKTKKLEIVIDIGKETTSSIKRETKEDVVKHIDMLVQRVSSACRLIPNFSIVTRDKIDFLAMVIFPNRSFNTVLLSDMIMNDYVFSHFLAVKEFDQPSKMLTHGLYSQFFIKNAQGTCDLRSKKRDRNDQDIRQYIPIAQLPEGNPFVRLIIKDAGNEEIVDDVTKIISKLLSIYADKEKTYSDLYKKYNCRIDYDDEYNDMGVNPARPLTLKDYDPRFGSGIYTRKCQHSPRIVENQAEFDRIPQENKMVFSAKPEDGFQYNYSCDAREDNYKYIGVIADSSTNEFLPCCFQADQYKKKNSNLNKYLRGEKPEKKEIAIQQNILKTSKFAAVGDFGALPKNVESLLTMLQTDTQEPYVYNRRGVRTFGMSFFECVMLAVLDNGTLKDVSNEVLLQEYNTLLTKNLALSSQENYGKSIREIRDELENIRNGNAYMDPRKWIHLLEEIYQIKIIVFSRGHDEDDATLIVPSHCLNYLSLSARRYKSFAVIYEHYGGESTQKERIRRCEVIVNTIAKGNEKVIKNVFIADMWKNINHYEKDMLQQYNYQSLSRKIDNVESFSFSTEFKSSISAQYIDPCGKVRSLKIRNTVFFSTPLPPFNTVLFDIYDINTEGDDKNFREAMEIPFLELHQLTTDHNNMVVESHFRIKDDINNNILTLKTKPFVFENIDNVPNVPRKYPSTTNELNMFFSKKRLAEILIEYFIYFYSYYCDVHKIKIDNIDNIDNIKKFIQQSVSVVNDYSAYIIPTTPIVSIDIIRMKRFIQNDKFIADSEETRRRLVYSLRYRMKTDIDLVSTYHSRNEIQNFYNNIAVYAYETNKETIVVNDLSIIRTSDNHIYSIPQTEKTRQFIQHPVISPLPVFLWSASSRDTAKRISHKWLTTGRTEDIENDGNKNDKNIHDNLYVVESRENVKAFGPSDDVEANAETLVYRDPLTENLQYMAVQRM